MLGSHIERFLFISLQPMKLRTGEELQLCIGFNPAYAEDLLIRAAEKALQIRFLEHPHEEQVSVRGEVYFPNLQIQTTALDFGCILNGTKDVRYVEMTNCSPLVVQYHWSFLKDSEVNPVRYVHLCLSWRLFFLMSCFALGKARGRLPDLTNYFQPALEEITPVSCAQPRCSGNR